MDLNADGLVDILSGSYSRMEGSMAGLFQVLHGVEGGGFSAAEVLAGQDGQPLIIQVPPVEGDAASEAGPSNDDDTPRICTRPFAADLDGDGHLDLVSGNFMGTFAYFRGLGKGQFASKASWLEGADGAPLRVEMHSDPTLVDWDNDGDLDLVSGAGNGAVSMFANVGTKSQPKFSSAIVLLEGLGHGDLDTRLGEAHVQRPQGSARIAVADVNGDKKLDLLVGDALHLNYAADGLTDEEAKARLAAWNAEMAALQAQQPEVEWVNGEVSEEDQELLDAFWAKLEPLYAKRAEFMREESTGSVWLMLQK